jgi:hypothetical protein
MLARPLYVAVAACVLVASCSREVAAPPERAPAADAVSPAPAAAPPRAASQAAPETAIDDIRRRYDDVRGRLSSFREVKRDLPGLSTEGGMLQAFFDGQALMLARATFYGESGRVEREFYYDESGRPSFVLEVEMPYETPLGAATGRREYRYYFYEGRLIRLLSGDRQVPPDDAAHATRVKNVLDLSQRLRGAARDQ